MKYVYFFIALISLFSVVSCGPQETSEVADDASLEGDFDVKSFVSESSEALNIDYVLPTNMTESTELIPDSPFQFVDTLKNYCLVGYVETVESAKSGLENLNFYDGSIPFPSAYNGYMCEMMTKNTFEHTLPYNERSLTLNGYPGKLSQIDMKVDAQSPTLVYWVASFECKRNFYRFIGWTEKKDQAAFDDIFVNFLASVHIKK